MRRQGDARASARRSAVATPQLIAATLAGALWGSLVVGAIGCDRSGKSSDRRQQDERRRDPRPKIPDIPSSGPLAQRALCEQGRGLLRKGAARRAVSVLRRGIEAGDDVRQRALCYLALGAALEAIAEPSRAVKAYRHATRLQPDDAAIAHALGLGLAASGDREGARAALRRALQLDRDLLVAYQDLMALQLAAKQRKRARATYARYEQRRAALLEAAGRKDAPQRERAIRALGSARDPKTARELLALLGPSTGARRIDLIEAIGEQGQRFAAHRLRELLHGDPEPRERRAIKRALSAIERAPRLGAPAPKGAAPPAAQRPTRDR